MTTQPQYGNFCWTELSSPNVPASKEFYSKVFGWQFVDHDMGDMTYTMIKLNGQDMMGGIWGIPKEMQAHIPPHWMTYILVEDADAALEKAQQNGAKVVKPVSPAGDFGRFAIIADPTGAHVALWQTLKK